MATIWNTVGSGYVGGYGGLSKSGLCVFRCSLSPSQVAGQPSSDGGRQGQSDSLGYQCITRHCIKVSRQVYGHTHCKVKWFPLVEACLDARCKLEEGRCSRVSGSEAVIFSW